MKKLLLAAAACGLLVSSGSAFAGCTQDDMMKKATEMQTLMATYTQKHPDKLAEVSAKVQAIGTKAQNPSNVEEVCKLYDDLIAVMK